LSHIPGKFKSKIWINPEDLVLINLRDYQEDKCDIIYQYTPQEVRKLSKMGELNQCLNPNHFGIVDDNDQINFEYDDESDSDEIVHNIATISDESNESNESNEINLDDL
jgi:translation initiation factor 1A